MKVDSIFSLHDRVAIVTGGGRGLGEAMAFALARAGASVVVANRTVSRAEEAAQKIIAEGGNAMAVQVDVADRESVDRMVSACLDKFGTIDILVNNAGITKRHPIIDFPDEDWDQVIDINLKGTFYCSRAVGPTLIAKKRGKVINMTSVYGTVAMPERGAYASSKGAVIQFTKVLALEWAPFRINVNAIGPGTFMTEMNTAILQEPEKARVMMSKTPMGYWADPEELSGPVVFLASDASSFVTGQTLFVDGGFISW